MKQKTLILTLTLFTTLGLSVYATTTWHDPAFIKTNRLPNSSELTKIKENLSYLKSYVGVTVGSGSGSESCRWVRSSSCASTDAPGLSCSQGEYLQSFERDYAGCYVSESRLSLYCCKFE